MMTGKQFLIFTAMICGLLAGAADNNVRLDLSTKDNPLTEIASNNITFYRNNWEAGRKDFHLVALTPAATNWQKNQVRFKAERDGELTLMLRSHSKDRVFFSKLSVSDVELKNGDFAAMTGWWTPPKSEAVMLAGAGYEQSNAVRVNHDNAYSTRFLIRGGIEYTVTFYAKSAEPPPSPDLRVNFTQAKALKVSDKGKFDGLLPEGWRPDYPGWTSCEATSEVINEGMEHFLRINVTKMDSQRVQFVRPIIRPCEDVYYILTLQYRNMQNNKGEILIRQLATPYRTLWSVPLDISGDWRKQSYVFKIQPNLPGPVGLFIYMSAVGAMDLVSLDLREAHGEEIQKGGVSIRRPDFASPNFLRNSRLPMGIQSGWNFGRDKTPVLRVDGTPGPSGSPGLTFEKGRLWGEPFQVAEPGKTHTFSLSYKGAGKVNVAGKSYDLPLSPEWRRAAFAFVPAPEARGYQFILEANPVLTVDAFRVAPGDAAEYLPAMPCEVALTLPKSEISETRIQFVDEPFAIQYLPTGKFDGAQLQVCVIDLYGQSKSETLPLPGTGVIDLTPLTGVALGQFRVEAVVVRDGKPISPVNEFVVTRLPRPVYWGKDGADSPFGIHVMANDPVLKTVKAGGVNHVRLHDAGTEYLGWAFLEPKRGEWSYRDDEIALYRQNHLKILGVLSTAPAWATDVGDNVKNISQMNWLDRYRLNYAAPHELADFDRYVATVVKKYEQSIDEYAVWNEPWSNTFWYQGYDADGKMIVHQDKLRAYFDLQKNAYTAAKAVDSSVRIAGYNTVAGTIGESWNRGMTALGADRYCDIIDFHLYNDRYAGYPGDVPEQAVKELRETVGNDFKQQIYMSEGQGASKSSMNEALGEYVGIYHYTIPWQNRDNNIEIAELQVRYLVSLISSGVSRVFLYTAHSYEGLLRQPNFLALLQADGYPHPQLVAHAVLARHIDGKQFVRRQSLDDKLFVYYFAGDGQTSAVVIPRKNAPPVQIKSRLAGSVMIDLFGNVKDHAALSPQVLSYISANVSPEMLAESLYWEVKDEK